MKDKKERCIPEDFLSAVLWDDKTIEVPPAEEWIPTEETFISERDFVLFVSDLHLSDWGRGDDFMWGHNEGPLAPVFDKTLLFAMALAFAMVRAWRNGSPGVELVLSGDTFDLWEMMGRGTAFAHPGFIGLLAAFQAIPGNNIVIITGNHDWIVPPLPIWRVADAYWNPTLSVYATHGHQWDSWNNAPANPNCPGRKIAQTTATIEVHHGNRLFTPSFPFCLIDNIKPLNYKQLKAFINHRLTLLGKILRWFIPRQLKLIGNIVGPLALVDNDDYLINAATGIAGGTISAPGIPAGARVRRVVFGHTHVPAFSIPYFNTGTWTPLLSIYFNPAGVPIETLLDLNPQLHIYFNNMLGRVVEELFYYNTAIPLGPGIAPFQQSPNTVSRLRKALGYK